MIDVPMKVATGRVVEGTIVLEGEPLAEGAVVTVVAEEGLAARGASGHC